MVRRLVLLAGLALAARAQGPTVVKVAGQGHARPTIPPVTDDPPGDYVDPQRGHDMDKGGTTLSEYDLTHGIQPDDKQRWAATDRIDCRNRSPGLP